MLKESIASKLAMIVQLYEEVENELEELTGGVFSICTPHIQLYADVLDDYVHDLAELEHYVGPIKWAYTTTDGCQAYTFHVDGVSGKRTLSPIIIMPFNTIDTRKALTGGDLQ